jgi:hypothetical protein
MSDSGRIPHILHVEDNSGDVFLTRLALEECRRQFTFQMTSDVNRRP